MSIDKPGEIAAVFRSLSSTYGSYACWGNHDVSEKILAGFTFPQKETIVRDGRFTEFLHHAGITMLEDETVCIDNAFYLVGRRDKDMQKKNKLLRKTFSEITEPLDPSLPIIVMDHQPGELSEAPMPVSTWTSPDTPMRSDVSGKPCGPFSLGTPAEF